MNHGLFQTFLSQFDVTEDVNTPQSIGIIVDGVMRFDREAD